MINETEFTRKSPEEYAGNMDVPLGWVVLPAKLVSNKTMRRKLHGKWAVLKSSHSSICRVISFNNLEISELVIDWMGWVKLHNYDDGDLQNIALTVRKANFFDILSVMFLHPDPTYRLSGWVTWITFFLGLIIGYLLSI